MIEPSVTVNCVLSVEKWPQTEAVSSKIPNWTAYEPFLSLPYPADSNISGVTVTSYLLGRLNLVDFVAWNEKDLSMVTRLPCPQMLIGSSLMYAHWKPDDVEMAREREISKGFNSIRSTLAPLALVFPIIISP